MLKIFQERFNNFLHHSLDDIKDSGVKEACLYALEGSGKRLRPYLVFASSALPLEKDILWLCAAIEMVHCYSLVHDDLPAMDDDDYRRGRLSTHRAFDEATAILAGDALLTHAFSAILKTGFSEVQKLKCVELLSKASGMQGMIYGQCLDIANQNDATLSELDLMDIYRYKTGELLSASLMMGAIAGEHYQDLKTLEDVGYRWGRIFQIQDDVLEATQEFTVLGKSNQSDQLNKKVTYLNFHSLEDSEAEIQSEYERLKHDIMNLSHDYALVFEVLTQMKDRVK